MQFTTTRRRLIAAAAASALPSLGSAESSAKSTVKPYRIYAITFRGMTDVEKGFSEYFTSRKIPVQITYHDMNRDANRLAQFIEEIRATKPDLIYTWGTSVT